MEDHDRIFVVSKANDIGTWCAHSSTLGVHIMQGCHATHTDAFRKTFRVWASVEPTNTNFKNHISTRARGATPSGLNPKP